MSDRSGRLRSAAVGATPRAAATSSSKPKRKAKALLKPGNTKKSSERKRGRDDRRAVEASTTAEGKGGGDASGKNGGRTAEEGIVDERRQRSSSRPKIRVETGERTVKITHHHSPLVAIGPGGNKVRVRILRVESGGLNGRRSDGRAAVSRGGGRGDDTADGNGNENGHEKGGSSRRRRDGGAASSNPAATVPEARAAQSQSQIPSRLEQYLDALAPVDESDPRLIVLQTPPGFSLAQSVCSYGYFGLAPNVWIAHDRHDPADPLADNATDTGTYRRPLRYGERCAEVVVASVTQEDREDRGAAGRLLIALDRDVADPAHRRQLRQQVGRVVHVDLDLAAFHRLHPKAAARGFGRLFRSPTLWEDVVKTITNCNMQWAGTVAMNHRLCAQLGSPRGAFPTPTEVAKASQEHLKACRLGYRAGFIAKLAKAWVGGGIDIDVAWSEAPDRTRDELMTALKKLHGVGQFAAANISQLLGHYETVAYDTESRRLWHEEHGSPEKKGQMSPALRAKAVRHYEAYHPFQFVAYWYELWQNYERKNGRRSTKWTTKELGQL